jgi:transposase
MSIMETMERSKRRDRRSYTPEFKAEIVQRCLAGDRTLPEICRDFDLTPSAVRRWVTQAQIDAGKRPGLTSEEREELQRLRRENKRLQADVDLLKRATAFFAKETR